LVSGLPEAFFYRDREPRFADSQIFPGKFLDETWRALLELELAGKNRTHLGYRVDENCSLSLMSILADCCAGRTLRRITDRGRA
jgi:hypothetical protein